MDSPRVTISKHANHWEITWNSSPVPEAFACEIRRIVNKNTTYGNELHPYISQLVKSNSGDGVSLDVARNIQHIYARAKLIRNYHRITARGPQMAKLYSSGVDILEIAQKFDSPPLLAMKLILEERGVRSLDEVMRGRAALPDPRDALQLKLAADNDFESFSNVQKAAEVAKRAELAFVGWLRDSGIKLRTEAELIAEQVAQGGRASLTPDALFDEEVRINGIVVRWVDFKNYCGVEVPYLLRSNSAQAKKYFTEWGLGAICYKNSFVENMTLEGAMLLDGRALPVNWLG